jgi:ubiquitin-conjugating enzyme E2 O
VLVHENECKLLDRAFLFGDVVKRSLSSPQSGTVISVQSKVTLHHSFIDPNPDSGEIRSVENVPDSELKFTNEMKPGEFVVYRNCWMGIVEDVSEILQVKLKNGAVVEVNGEEHVEIPVATSGHWTQPAESESFPVGHASARVEPAAPAQLSGKRGCLASKTKTVPPPAQLSPGQTVMVRAELWDLRYVFGSYDPSVSPIGVVVDSKVSRIEVNWICQNMMVKAPFVSVEKPPMMMIWKEVSDDIRIFKKSSGGYVNTEGQKYTHVNEASGGGELQVGDRVKFIDIDAAVAKYQGMVKKFLPAETMGFDINTFIVAATRTTVRILWQDTTETIDDARNLVPYLNVDDHEVWPGEIVVIRPEESFNAGEKLEQQVDVDSILSEQDHYGRSLFEACEAIRPTGGHEPPKMEFMRPQRVGVVQSVNSADRVAVVRWFASPRIDVAAGFLIPGSETGPLEPTAEDVSLYDAVAHQAIGVQRGDMVLVAPLNSDAQQGKPEVPSQSTAAPSNVDSGHLNQIINRGHGTVNGGLISNLSAALGSHSSPHLQAVSRALNQLPELVATHFPSMDVISYNSTDSFADQQSGWLGEVVHLDMEGQATVRLGALKEPRDIRVPVEKLHIVFNDEMDFGDDDLEDEDENYDTDSEEMSSNDDIIEYVHASERQVIEEKVFYEGGERLDNGKEEDWLTDSEGENDSVSDKILDQGLTGRAPTPPDDLTDSAVPKNSESESTPPKADSGAEVSLDTVLVTANTDAQAAAPSLSDNMPVPEVFSLSATAGSPPRFMVLDEQIPSDHAFRNHVKTSMYSAYARRIAREHKILSTSLPEGIFVRTWESRLDLMRVLIIGPLNTPYELAPFVFDFHFTAAFPVNPPVGYFHSWTNGIGRVNPNLYEDGKICLSLLGTWHAERRGESWTSSGSTVLQLLVSLMGLVLVREPWYSMYPLHPYSCFLILFRVGVF